MNLPVQRVGVGVNSGPLIRLRRDNGSSSSEGETRVLVVGAGGREMGPRFGMWNMDPLVCDQE